jgi:hypothetical protein
MEQVSFIDKTACRQEQTIAQPSLKQRSSIGKVPLLSEGSPKDERRFADGWCRGMCIIE